MRPLPLRVRLTGWYLVVISLALGLYSAAMYFGFRSAVGNTVDRQLSLRASSIEQMLRSSSLPLASGDELYRVLDSSGNVVQQAPGMEELKVPVDTSRRRNHYRHYMDQGDYTTFYNRDNEVRALSTRIRISDRDYTVQVATVVTQLNEVLQGFREWGWIGSLTILCLAGAGGYWLSKRTLRPIQQLVLSTKGISEQNLSQRVSLPAANDELRELATTMNAMLTRLELAFERITQFTADASHELRTPVAVIRTTAEVMLEKQRPSEEMRAMANDILREAEFTSGLIEHLLLLARADTREAASPLVVLDLKDLVIELDPVARKLADSRRIEWQSESATTPVLVMGNRPLLRRLLLILIDNACRYTRAGGLASLTLSTVGADAVIEVKDTGIGIPAAECAHIFDRFYRAENARFFNADGTGLGLAIARWIATVHQGTLQVTSVVEKGTTLTLLLREVTVA